MNYFLKVLTRFSFRGRARRAEYWWFAIISAIIGFAARVGGQYFGWAITAPADEFGPEETFSIPELIWTLATLVQSLAVSVRRFHDRNMSGWWFALIFVLAIPALFIPFAIAIPALAMLAITVLPGTQGPNKYGEDPKAELSA